MNRSLTAALAAVSLIALAGCQQQAAAPNEAAATAGADALDGTWKADVASVKFEGKPDVYLLKDGKFACSTCEPPYEQAADGAFHPIADRAYFDSQAIKVADDKTVTFTRRKGDRVVIEQSFAVSPDGKTMTIDFNDMTVAGAPATKGKSSMSRVAEGAAGSHAVSGSWQADRPLAINDEALTFTIDREGDTINLSSPSGISYSAKLGGPEVPVKGDPGGTTIAVEAVGETGFKETYRRGGKVTNVSTYTLGADGKLSGVSQDQPSGDITRYTANKQ